jgi:tetratricopeptide (TPR) repeat protein
MQISARALRLSPSVRRAARVLVALAPVLLAPSVSVAAPSGSKEAKQHFRRGATEYNLGHFEEAISEFEKAYQLEPSPILLFNIGQAHRKLGNGPRAVFFFKRYLQEDPETKDRPKVEQWIRELEEAVKLPPAPAPEPSPPAPSSTSTPVSAPPSVPPPAPEPALAAGLDQGPHARMAWRRPAAWATAAVAVGAMALGIQQAVRFSDKRDAFAAIAACGEAEMNRGSDSRCKTIYDAGERAKTISIVGFVASGLLGGASATLFVLSSPGQSSQTARLQSCRVLGLAASCQFRF